MRGGGQPHRSGGGVGSPAAGRRHERSGASSAARASPRDGSGATSAEPRRELEQQRELIQALRDRVRAAEQERIELERRLDQILRSSSWRLTRPFRGFAEWCRHVDVRGKAPAPGLVAARALLGIKAMLRPGLRALLRRRRASDVLALASRGSHPPGGSTAAETVAAAGLRAFLASGARLSLPTSPRPRLSIVMAVFNRAELTFDCLRSLAEAAPRSFELIVVDNASTDATPRLLERVDGIRVERNPENRHLLLAVNGVLERVRGSRLLFLNNDTLVLPGSIESALQTLDAAPDVGAVGGRIVHMDGTLQEAGSILWRDGTSVGYGNGDDPLAPPYMFERTVDYCSAAFLLTRTRLFRELDGFCEDFRPAYYEDVDYCLRLRQRGYRVVYDPGATILHYESASASSVYEPLELTLAHRPVLLARHRDVLAGQQAPLPENVLAARSVSPGGARTLLIEDRVPHPRLGSGFPRSRLLVDGLLARGHALTLFPTDVCEEDWSRVYGELPRQVEVMLGLGPDRLEAFLHERRGFYANVVVTRPHNMERLAPLLSRSPGLLAGARLVYDAEALYALREADRGFPDGGASVEALAAEVALARMADVVTAASEGERRLLADRGVKARVLGHCVAARPGSRAHGERSGLLFVGAFHRESSPNADALRWFLREILPLLDAALGERVPVTVAGFGAERAAAELASARVRFTGCLDDLTALYDASRVFVAPHRVGAGIPLKVLEAAAVGVPVATTPLMARQLGWGEKELAVGADAASFAESCLLLYADPGAWSERRGAALRRVAADWSREVFEAQLDAVFGGSGGADP